MRTLKYIVYREDKFFVSQCLNVDVSSFGKSIEEAIDNLKEALQLYFEDNISVGKITSIQETLVGETTLNV